MCSLFRDYNTAKYSVIVLGDFNVDYSKHNEEKRSLQKLMYGRGLTQMVHQCTTDMRTTLDHIYTNIQDVKIGITENYYSFHKGVWIAIMYTVILLHKH